MFSDQVAFWWEGWEQSAPLRQESLLDTEHKNIVFCWGFFLSPRGEKNYNSFHICVMLCVTDGLSGPKYR